jgi:hypothetical protein
VIVVKRWTQRVAQRASDACHYLAELGLLDVIPQFRRYSPLFARNVVKTLSPIVFRRML